MRFYGRGLSAAARWAAVSLALTAPAHAEEDERGWTFNLDPIVFKLTLDAATSVHSVQNARHGIGTTSRNGVRHGGRQWSEGFLKPTLGFEAPAVATGTFYGAVSVIGSATRGAGEANAPSTTSDQPEYFAVNDLYAGWRSGSAWGDVLPENATDLSLGHRDFTVGDGFLITNGTLDGGGRAANYLGPRNVFERTGILQINTEPVRADIFHLEGGVDQRKMRGGDNPATKLYGGNVEWFRSSEKDEGRFDYAQRRWYLGGTYLKIYDADRDFSFVGLQGGGALGANRDGLSTYSVRGGGSFLPIVEALALYGEWASQRNGAGGNGGKVRAAAWYVQPQYTFESVPWQPVLSWRYAHFSGDGNGADTTDRSWDPLYSDSGPRGANTWTQGQIYSQYVGANSNLNTHHVGVEAEPIAKTLRLGFAYFRHDFNKPAQAGAISDRLMDEYNIYATWNTPIPGLTAMPTLGMGRPGDGQKQALGNVDANDKTIWLAQFVLSYAY